MSSAVAALPRARSRRRHAESSHYLRVQVRRDMQAVCLVVEDTIDVDAVIYPQYDRFEIPEKAQMSIAG